MVSQAEQQRAFTEDLQRVHHQLFGYIFALLRNLEDTQEVYQQTCLAMWQKYGQFEGRSDFGTWACGFARNKVMDYCKSRQRYRHRFSEAFEEQIARMQMATPPREIEDRREALDACLEMLPAKDRHLVTEIYGRGASVRETAERLGRSVHSVHGSWRRVRERLIECVDRRIAREEQA